MEKSYIITIIEPNKELKFKQKPNFFIEIIKLEMEYEYKERQEKKENILQYGSRAC